MGWFDGPFGDLWFWFMVLHGLLTVYGCGGVCWLFIYGLVLCFDLGC